MRIILIALFVSFGTITYSQTDVDALRFSHSGFGGTARGMGVAGAFGALGGDITSATINPAGIGIYRSSEFVITPALYNVWNDAQFLNNKDREFRYNFNFSNLGLATSYEPWGDNWKRINFAFGYNRINDFHKKVFFHGFNTQSSMLDRYIEIAEINNVHARDISNSLPFSAGLAYENFLIDPLPSDSTRYVSIIPNGNVEQLQKSTIKGKVDEWFISMAANYNDKVFLGATIGIPFLKYNEETIYEENDLYDSIPGFNKFSVTNNINTRGYGVNLKLGLIYRLNDFVRFGGALHTPTYFWLEDDYSTFMTSDFDTSAYDWSSPEGEYSYKLLTPMKVVGSLALLANNYGFISIDYEWLDYGQSLFEFDTKTVKEEILESGINQAIDDKYTYASNLRLGAEGKLDIYRIRAGFALYDSPIHPSSITEGGDIKRTSITFGVGLREEEYFLDLAYVRTTTTEYYSPYDLATIETPGAIMDITQNNILLSMGLKF